MSDVARGPGWWQASDGRWYPPEALAQAMQQAPEQVPPAPVDTPPGAPQWGGPGAPPDAPSWGGPGEGAPPWYGPAPGPEPGHYPWPGYATYAAWHRHRLIGALLVLLGLAGVVWGIGELFAAMALNSSPIYPHDEQVGAWILTAGILSASVVTMVIGLVYRRG